jgi:hypothetical protein
MSNIEQDFDEENNITQEEQSKIEQIKVVSYICDQPSNYKNTEKYEEQNASLEKFIGDKSVLLEIERIKNVAFLSREAASFDPLRRIGISKVVTINNISGKNAWVILSPNPITSVSSIEIYKLGKITIETKGDYKPQHISIANNARGEYDLDNSLTYVSLFLNIDEKWKKVWLDRLFNTRKYNINILERHVNIAQDFKFC